MPATVFGQLDESLRQHLAHLVALSSRADDPAIVKITRVELPRLVAALTALLDEHHPDEHGRCPTCRTNWWRRRNRTPCRAYLAAHLCMLVSDTVGHGRHSHHLSTAG